jgi:hypothetical protein
MQGYPPGIVTLNVFLLRWFRPSGMLPSTVIPIVRLLSIAFSLLSIIMLALLGYRIAGHLLGLLAAALWAFTPIMVEYSRYATPDSFVTAFSLLALFLSLTATLDDRDQYATAATVSLMFAIIFKYQAIFIAPIIILLPLSRWFTQSPVERRHIIGNFIRNSAYFSIFLFWLIGIFPALDAARSPEWAASTSRLSIPTPQILWSNLQGVVSSIQFAKAGYAADAPLAPDFESQTLKTFKLIAGIAGLGLLALPNFRRRLGLVGLAASILVLVLWWVGVSIYGAQGLRQLVLVAAIITMLYALGLLGWVRLGGYLWGQLVERIAVLGKIFHQSWIGEGVVVIVIVMLNIPNAAASLANAYEHTLPDRRNDLASWADRSLETGLYVADRPNHKIFEPFWGGYQGATSFQLYKLLVVNNNYRGITISEVLDSVNNQQLKEWRDNKVLYLILSSDIYQAMQASAEDRKGFEQMVQLKSYPASSNYRDPGMVFFRIYPMQHRAEGQLGPIHLLGYDIDTTRVKAGESFTIRYYFQADQTPDADYFVFNHLVPEGDIQPSAQFDGPPLLRRSTTLWDDPMEIIYSRAYTISVGADVAPGVYHLLMGFYRLDTGERLLAPNNDSFLKVLTIRVSKP